MNSYEEFTIKFLVGAECGYDEGLKRIGKGITCQDLEDAACKLHRRGLSTCTDFSFIIGLPWETKTEVEKTIAFAVRLHTLYEVNIILGWYLQIPGSHLWKDSRQKEIINEAMYDHYGFFRDLYLFKSGVRLTPKEIWEICDKVNLLKGFSRLKNGNDNAIKFNIPPPIYERFPRVALLEESIENIVR